MYKISNITWTNKNNNDINWWINDELCIDDKPEPETPGQTFQNDEIIDEDFF